MKKISDAEKSAAFNDALRSRGHGSKTVDTVSFDHSPREGELVDLIVQRVTELHARDGRDFVGQLDTRMDLVACHANGCPMDFEKLLAADEFTFWHDLNGIARHIDRGTGELMNFFLPRCAQKEVQI